ncbi:GTPase-activating protein [Entomortierella beljakovae]|nr:GTPase-activating protein [Entomortierella beljakovae]
MMAHKRNSYTSQEGQDCNPVNGFHTTSNTETNSGHETQHSIDQLVKSPEKPSEKDFKGSWEEDSDEEPYTNGYTYDREDTVSDDDDDSDDNNTNNKNNNEPQYHGNKSPKVKSIGLERKTFNQESDSEDEKPPNKDLFKVNSRTSVISNRSYSSHTKHHSFGYDGVRPELSDSESNSESESDQDETFINAPSSPFIVAPLRSRQESNHSTSNTVLSSHSPASTLSTAADTQGSEKSTKDIQGETFHSSQESSTSLPSNDAKLSAPVNLSQEPGKLPSSLLNSKDGLHRRTSDSESDTSNSSNNDRSLPMNSHSRNTSKSGILQRSISGISTSSRGPISGLLGQARSSSYSDVSDAELNDISLDDPSTPGTPRRSGSTVATPKAPITTSNAGFPSSFFGGKPHPKSQQFLQHQSSIVSPQPLVAAEATPPLPPTAAAASTSPEPRSTGVLNGSISSLASSIQGAFMGRGFGVGSSSSALPPVPTRSPSMSSTRRSITSMIINTSNIGIDLRPSNNISPERASTYSTMTTDSNMDLLLARLEAENSMLEQDSKRRLTSDSEMDRAIGHAKEESAEEDIDWDYWGALMHDYNGVAKKNPKQLTQMIQKGVPPALRGLIWQLLSKSKDAQLESSYAELLKATSLHEKQINRDMSRTFPNHEYFQAEGLGQESMFNVVKAYSLYDKEVGYCQGLSFVVGPLLLNMPDEEAFCVLVRMMNSYSMRGHYTPDMNMLQLRLYQFEQLLEETIPMIHRHFQNQGIRSTMYASQWFMTLFAYKFPLDLVFRIYDILFVEGVDSLLRFAIALLKANEDKILSHDFETLIEFLKNGLFDHYKDNPSLFVRDAYNVKVTPRKLTQYTQKYNNMIQKQQAELAAEESLRESNRQLSSHVRRLEGSLHSLNKEHVDLAKELIARKVDNAQLHDQNDVLTQKVSDLTRIVDSQAKEVEDRLRDDIQSVMEKNVNLVRKNEQLEDQCSLLEGLLIETKMKYAESENERDTLIRKLADLKKALGVV